MNTTLRSIADAAERAFSLILVIVVVALAYLFFIQPRLAQAIGSQTDLAPLQERVRSMQRIIARGISQQPPETASLHEFERRVPEEDRVAEVVEALAKAAVDSATPGQVKALVVEAGNRRHRSASANRGGPRAAGSDRDTADPRLDLFDLPVESTPIMVSFDSSAEGIAKFFWSLPQMPALVTIKSAELKRGLPLMSVKAVLLVHNRAGSARTTMVPGDPSVPRVASEQAATAWASPRTDAGAGSQPRGAPSSVAERRPGVSVP